MKQIYPLWEKIFIAKALDVTQDLHFITADEIKEIAHHEPRNMAKVDSLADLPPIFKKYGYFLLPVTKGKYAIVRGNGFHVLEKIVKAQKHISRIPFPLLTAARGLGEMQYVDYSVNSGGLEDVVGEKSLYPSIRGRERSGSFSFMVSNVKIDVSSVQMEVDLGLEGPDSIYLIEAKINTPKDFLIRQLYYPYRNFRNLASSKKVVPIFFTYDTKNRIYNFWIYEFVEEGNYNSIKLVKRKSLEIVTQKEVELSKLKPAGTVRQKNLIPQANDLNKIITLVHKIKEGIDNYKDVSDYFQFDPRQSSYYREAAEALDLVQSVKGKYYLTDTGEKLVALAVEERNIFLTQLLLNFKLIKISFDLLHEKRFLDKKTIEQLIRENSNLSGTTPGRRADSLYSWFKWVAEATNTFYEDKENKTFKLINKGSQ